MNHKTTEYSNKGFSVTEVDQLSINGREYFFKQAVVNPCYCGAVEVDNGIRSIKAI